MIRLREWATTHVHPLPEDATGPVTLGTAATCAIRVRDPSRHPGQVYARIERIFGRWALLDAGSERGISINGARCLYVELRPGVEISLGGAVTLIAESPRLILLREALERLLGWSPARRARVDEALRQIRDHDLQRRTLTLCGGPQERDLIPIAQELHRLTLTEAQPFVVYDPRRRVTRSEGGAPTFSDLAAALREAKDGTLCLEHRKVSSRDVMAICLAVLPKGCRTHIVHCGNDPDDPKLPTPRIVIPPLGARKTEIDRLIREYLREATALLGDTKHVRLSPADRAWLRTSASASLPELRTATLRLVAVRVAKDVQAASTLLGISHAALRRWLNDRGFSKLEAAGARATRRSGPRRGAGQDRRQLGRRR
ncbi:MAG TPA: FHA domain-containing protein [Kofleriaceae bacterium]|nr:FHA domain-containing protein [Kofleriaceae bacterium]